MKTCNECVCSKDTNKKNTVCEICHHIEEIGNGSMHHFRERIKKPSCCGICQHKAVVGIDDLNVCQASQYYDKDEDHIRIKTIRSNYLKKNTPKWCPLDTKNINAQND